MSTRRKPNRYTTIDDRAAEEIRRLHKLYPRLGHEGLLKALAESGITVDEHEMKAFLLAGRIAPEKPWRPLRWRGVPAWLGGVAHPGLTDTLDGGDGGDGD